MRILIIIIILFFASCAPAIAQNYVGCSKKTITDQLHNKGYVLHDYPETDNMFNYIVVNNESATMQYIFNSNNLCIKYVYWVNGETFSGLESILIDLGYIRHADNYYYTDDYVAKIEYNSKSESWTIVIIPNIK